MGANLLRLCGLRVSVVGICRSARAMIAGRQEFLSGPQMQNEEGPPPGSHLPEGGPFSVPAAAQQALPVPDRPLSIFMLTDGQPNASPKMGHPAGGGRPGRPSFTGRWFLACASCLVWECPFCEAAGWHGRSSGGDSASRCRDFGRPSVLRSNKRSPENPLQPRARPVALPAISRRTVRAVAGARLAPSHPSRCRATRTLFRTRPPTGNAPAGKVSVPPAPLRRQAWMGTLVIIQPPE